MNGRHDDPTAARCHRCGWVGTVAGCIHSYKAFHDNGGGIEVEPVDYCPNCGSDELEELIRRVYASKSNAGEANG